MIENPGREARVFSLRGASRQAVTGLMDRLGARYDAACQNCRSNDMNRMLQ
jgi:hypothetical protein